MAVLVEGELSAVEAAVRAGEAGARKVGRFRRSLVIPAPDDTTWQLTAMGRGFCMTGGDPDHVC